MKSFGYAVFSLLLTSSTAWAQIEGVAEMKMTFSSGNQGEKGTGKIIFYVAKSGSRSEMEIGGPDLKRTAGVGSFKMIMIQKFADPDTVYSINESTKSYTVMNLAEIRQKTKGKTQEETYSVKKLGRDSVASYPCEKALLTSSRGDETEVCVSSELFGAADWFEKLNRSEIQRGGIFKALKENGLVGMPIRMFMKAKERSGTEAAMELVSYKKQAVSASLLEIPPGYKKTDPMGMFLSPEAQKQMQEMMKKMTPEQRKQIEDAMKKGGH